MYSNLQSKKRRVCIFSTWVWWEKHGDPGNAVRVQTSWSAGWEVGVQSWPWACGGDRSSPIRDAPTGRWAFSNLPEAPQQGKDEAYGQEGSSHSGAPNRAPDIKTLCAWALPICDDLRTPIWTIVYLLPLAWVGVEMPTGNRLATHLGP